MAFDEDVPLAANQISADLTAMNANWEFIIHGDGTANRVIRRIEIQIADGTNANTIKPKGVNVWNGDTIAEEDNLGKSGDTGNFNLDANGNILTIEAGGLSGNGVAVLAAEIVYNASGTVATVQGDILSNNIRLSFKNASSGAAYDLTSAVDSGDIYAWVTYLTDA